MRTKKDGGHKNKINYRVHIEVSFINLSILSIIHFGIIELPPCISSQSNIVLTQIITYVSK